MNICAEFNCPFWSEGTKRDGVLGGYGCRKYSVAQHCPISSIKDAESNGYGLSMPDGKISGNKRWLIEMAVSAITEQSKEKV